MRSPIAYSPDPGPLGRASALAATVYLGSIAVVAFACSNPLVLAGAAAAVVAAGLAAGAGHALAASARWAATLGVLIVAVNGFASQRGETVLVRGWDLPLLGQVDVSGEALAEGAILALRIGVVLGAFAVHSARVDPDRLLRLVRPLARHSALTAALITRLVPLAAADHARLREAMALRGPGAAAGGRAAIARRLLAGSLDRAVEIAASLELRGYARGAPRAGGRHRASRHSWRFATAGLAIAVLGIGARIAGAGDFDPYPVTVVEADPATLALAAALPVLAAAPFAGIRGRRG
jgi:energy-coupling factor transport system permease protein